MKGTDEIRERGRDSEEEARERGRKRGGEEIGCDGVYPKVRATK